MQEKYRSTASAGAQRGVYNLHWYKYISPSACIRVALGTAAIQPPGSPPATQGLVLPSFLPPPSRHTSPASLSYTESSRATHSTRDSVVRRSSPPSANNHGLQRGSDVAWVVVIVRR